MTSLSSFLPPPPPSLFLLFKLDVSLIDSLSCLIALDTASNNMLNRSGWSGHSCLVLDFRVEVFSHSLPSMIRAVGFSYLAFIMWSCFLIFRVCWMFSLWNDVAFCQTLFLHRFRWLCVSPFHSADVVSYSDRFPCVVSSLLYWNKFCLVTVHNPFRTLFNSVC